MSNDIIQVCVPDIGGAKNVDVIEVVVTPGMRVEKEQTLLTLEGDKATMDVPSPEAGVVQAIQVKVGDKVSEGSLILTLATSAAAAEIAMRAESASVPKASPTEPEPVMTASTAANAANAAKPGSIRETHPAQASAATALSAEGDACGDLYAGPGVRRLAAELEIELRSIKGTGPKGRIQKADLQHYIKARMQAAPAANGGWFPTLSAPTAIDFSKFGAVDVQPLSKIKKLSGMNLHRNWVSIPHVTQFDEADITELEAFRKTQTQEAKAQNVKLTPLVFVMKAVVKALQQFPQFNASLDASGENLVLKKYFHIGVAVDTPNGLVVPVIRDVDRKGVFQLARELAEISQKAREKGLGLADMQGSSFSISSLGGIGGTAFTPIINAPDVAILGVARSQIKPQYCSEGEQSAFSGLRKIPGLQKILPTAQSFAARLMLPLCLSYDHRVIDGAEGARFIVCLKNCLEDIRNLLL